MKKKRMAFIDLCNFSDWPMGGMLQYELQILETLTERFELELWGVSVDGVAPEPLCVRGRDYPVHTFANVTRGRRLIPNFWRGLALGRYKAALAPYDILYAHTGSCALAALRMKAPDKLLVYHQHGLQYLADASLKTLLQRPFMALAQRTADFSFVVAGSQELAAYIGRRRALAGKLVAIGSPVSPAAPAETPPEPREGETFIYVGRLAPVKRAALLVELFARFRRRYGGDSRLVIVGDGEDRAAVERAVAQNGLAERVLLTGTVPAKAVPQYLRRADVFVTASAGEGMSLSVLEAFQAGLPTVCFCVRGLREQVQDGVTGAVAPEGDMDGFVGAMARAAARRAELAPRCREEGGRFSAEAIGCRIAEEIEKRYEDQRHHPCI